MERDNSPGHERFTMQATSLPVPACPCPCTGRLFQKCSSPGGWCAMTAGPFEAEREAAASVGHIYGSPPGTGAWTAGNHQLLCEALAAAGVELSAVAGRVGTADLRGPGRADYAGPPCRGGHRQRSRGKVRAWGSIFACCPA
jgi:hypothetical protein